MKLAAVLAFAAVVAAYLLALWAFLAPPAAAQTQCGPRDAVLRVLARDYHEGVAGRGLAVNGQMVEVTVSPKGGWSIIVTSPQGVTCIAATGTGWEAVKDVLGVPG